MVNKTNDDGIPFDAIFVLTVEDLSNLVKMHYQNNIPNLLKASVLPLELYKDHGNKEWIKNETRPIFRLNISRMSEDHSRPKEQLELD